MIVLNTNVVSELMRAEPSANVLEWVDVQPASELWLTAITAAELVFGVARLPRGRRKDAVREAVTSLLDEDFADRVLPFDRYAAGNYGDLAAAWERRGRPISMADAQIAAICRHRGASLATRNVRDFDEAGITLINPWDSPG